MLFELLILGGAIVQGASQSSKNKKCQEDARLRQAFRDTDYIKQGMWYQDFCDDWFRGEKKYVPKKYHEYFKRNKKAAYQYLLALTSEKELRAGLRPSLAPGTFDIRTYNPFEGFKYQYEEKVNIFNETGKYYW